MSGNDERLNFEKLYCSCNWGVQEAFYTIGVNITTVGFVNLPKFLENYRRKDAINPIDDVGYDFQKYIKIVKGLFRKASYFLCPMCHKKYLRSSIKGQLILYYMMNFIEKLDNGEITSVWE